MVQFLQNTDLVVQHDHARLGILLDINHLQGKLPLPLYASTLVHLAGVALPNHVFLPVHIIAYRLTFIREERQGFRRNEVGQRTCSSELPVPLLLER